VLDLEKEKFDLDDLVEVMRILRSSSGCPWDREQTLETLREYCLEEAGEVAGAIDAVVSRGGDAEWRELCEELGDLLLQVIFQAQIASESGRFTHSDVITAIVKKLIRRHPHVFSDTDAETSDDVLVNWKVIKEAEKKAKELGRDLTPDEAEKLLSNEE